MVLLLSLLLTGCASSQGFDRSAIYAALPTGGGTVAEQKTPVTPEARVLSIPFRVALYFAQRDFPASDTIQKAEWVAADKDTLMKELEPLWKEKIVADTFLLADSTIQGNDVRQIQRAAERYGADAVLIVEGAGAVDRYNNGYAALYATLIGAYIAPGTVSEAVFIVRSSLWDVRTERLYMTETAEGHSKSTGAAVFIENSQVLAQAKKAALDEIGIRIADGFHRLRTAPSRTSDRSP